MISQNFSQGVVIHGFRVEGVETIAELRCEAALFTHIKTGARVFHLFNEDKNNLFSIAFRTPAYDNTGVPHILEHSVLCGSRKFPLKDPFQEMLKGSLQTFLNALTYPDKTVYPFSSQVETDFFNLADVYCDAVFNPILSEYTFYQEGWHFDIPALDSPVDIKGIVYNEMKGVFSDFSSHVIRRTIAGLMPDTIYANESGGDPDFITDLTFEQFREFHRRYYHPSNSYIFLYGNLPSEKTLHFLNDNYLKYFDFLHVDSTINPQPLWKQGRKIEFEAPAPKEADETASVLVGWLCGFATDPLSSMIGNIISRYLLATESSPLRRALIDSGLGEDLDDACGFSSELIQNVFIAGLRKVSLKNTSTVGELIFNFLRKHLHDGFDEQLLEGCIRQCEFNLREIAGSGSFPYNLRLAERCYQSWIYGGEPVAHLKFEKPLQKIKELRAENKDFFANVVKSTLLENSHHLISVIKGSYSMAQKLQTRTREQAQKLTKFFDEEQTRRYFEITQQLRKQQATPSLPEALAVLPRLTLADLPPFIEDIPIDIRAPQSVPLYLHDIFSAGIVYLDIGFDLHTISAELLQYIPVFAEYLCRTGAASFSFEQMAKRISLATGGIKNSFVCSAMNTSEPQTHARCFFHGKALTERFADMIDIFSDLFSSPQLDNKKLIKDIVLELRNNLSASVIANGHRFASQYASAQLLGAEYISEQLSGISQLRFLEHLARHIDEIPIVSIFDTIYRKLICREGCLLSITASKAADFMPMLSKLIGSIATQSPHRLDLTTKQNKNFSIGIEIAASVNFVAQAWNPGRLGIDDIANCYILSRNLSSGYLWDKIRVEGGAYGGKASFSMERPVFSCSSYRDPNLKTTLEHFINGLKKVAEGIDEKQLQQNIIGTIGWLDSPKSPHGKGFGETLATEAGFTKEYRQKIREKIITATPETLGRCAQMILNCYETAITVLGSSNALEAAAKEGVELSREKLLEVVVLDTAR